MIAHSMLDLLAIRSLHARKADHFLTRSAGLQPSRKRLPPDHPAKRIHELLPRNWRPQNVAHAA